jgi:hypothetical protein
MAAMRAARLGKLLHRVFGTNRFNDLSFRVLIYGFNAVIGIFFRAGLNGFGLLVGAFITLWRGLMRFRAVIIMRVIFMFIMLIIMTLVMAVIMMVMSLMPLIIVAVTIMSMIIMGMMFFMLLPGFKGGNLFDLTIHGFTGDLVTASAA